MTITNKKAARKLSVAKETLRALTQKDLESIVGGQSRNANSKPAVCSTGA
jgi:hypothetical protein